MTVARAWATYCRRTASAALASDVEARARLCVADHLHAAMHGAHSDTAALLRRYFGWESSAGATATDAESAALYSGAISAVHEIDDVHQDTSLHPGSVVVAAAIATAGELDVQGSRLLAAIVAGYEIAVRLSVASGHRHYHYFHSTATCGTVGAAAAASIVLGLDEDATAHAIGLAATSASGVWQGINDEAVMVKHSIRDGSRAWRGRRSSRNSDSGRRSIRSKATRASRALASPAARADESRRRATCFVFVTGLGERPAILRNICRYPFCLGCFEPLEGIRRLLAAPSAP
jgi:2-methylcitrate dehydratase PrpD